jgi:hypothetical protein
MRESYREASTEEKCLLCTDLIINQKGRHNLEDSGVDGRIILKLILNKQTVRVWIGFICRRN